MTVHERPFGRYLEDFVVGDVYRHWPGKTVTSDFSPLGNNIFDLFPIVKKSRPSYGDPNKGPRGPVAGEDECRNSRHRAYPETVFAKCAAAVRTPAFRLLRFHLPTQRKALRMTSITLTFDNGPDPDITPRVLETLRRHQIQSTFFVLGEKMRDRRADQSIG